MADVVGLFGPTACGKSAVAEAIAARTPARLVAADSAQLYRDLPILTNQSPAELVGIWELDHDASVGEYARLAHDAVDRTLREGRLPVVVGGTGLYFRAALAELDLPSAAPPEARGRAERLYERLGPREAHAALRERDPAAAEVVHPNDRRRVVRALELAEAGVSLRPAEDRLWAGETRHPTLVVGLTVPTEVLSARIERRTRAMFEEGVEEEVRQALERPLSPTARKILGLREVAELPREEAIRAVAARTRRLAAYQRKWMRRIPGLVPLDGNRPAEEVTDDVLALAGGGQRLPAGRAV